MQTTHNEHGCWKGHNQTCRFPVLLLMTSSVMVLFNGPLAHVHQNQSYKAASRSFHLGKEYCVAQLLLVLQVSIWETLAGENVQSNQLHSSKVVSILKQVLYFLLRKSSPLFCQTEPLLLLGDGVPLHLGESGKLITWGSTDDLRQSYLTSGKHEENPEPFPLPTEASIVKAAAGWAHCVAATGASMTPRSNNNALLSQQMLCIQPHRPSTATNYEVRLPQEWTY